MHFRTRSAGLAAAFALALSASSPAQTTGAYVDAVPADLPDGNTVHLSDRATGDFYDGPTAAWPPLRQDKWFLFSGDTGIDPLGQNKGTSLEFALFSNCCGFGTAPPILTTISGLEPGGLYDVYVHFVGAPWVPGGYGVQAAFLGETLQLFTDIDNSTETNLAGVGGLHTYQGLIGNTEAVNGEIKVELHASGQDRSYYAGLSYVKTGSAVVDLNLDVNWSAGPSLVFTWDSQAGKLYNLRSETDPSNGTPDTWPIFDGKADLPADPSGRNTLTLPVPAEPLRLFVIEQFTAPPASVFSDDFENGLGEWTTGGDPGLDPATNWELGTPSAVGPPAANSPTNCFGTNLTANYGNNALVWLRSPPIDLTNAAGATLSYFEFKDIEPGFDDGRIAVLDADGDSELAVIQDTIDGTSTAWGQVTLLMPPEALGKTVRLEFTLDSDELNEAPGWAGWYIDDVAVTVP